MNDGLSQWPEWHDLYDETAASAVDFIIGHMALPGVDAAGIDLEPHRGSLARCLADAREAYLIECWDWLGRVEPEGSQHRPHRDDRHNPNVASPYDYGEFSASPDAWREHWDAHHAKTVSTTGNRARNPGTFRGLPNGGPPLGKPMLAGVYHRVNRWWREALGSPFRPDFVGMAAADNVVDRMAHLNPAARLFVLFAQEVDPRFTMEHCARVHSEEARRQRTGK